MSQLILSPIVDNRSWLRPSTEDVSACPAPMHPSALRRTPEKKLLAQKISVLISRLMGTRWCDRCACVNLILRRTENFGEWSISLVREKTKLSFISQLYVSRPPGGGTPGNSWWGCAARFPKFWPLFQTKKCNFPHLFSDQTSKIHTRFQTWPSGRNYVIVT